jgi:phage-related protein
VQILLARCIRNDTVTECRDCCPLFSFGETRREPVREWLKDLPKDERRIIGEDIMTVQFRWPLGMPLVDNLGSGIWEIRSRLANRIARTLFFVHQEEIILLHGFIKKTRKTPNEDRALALRRKNAYLKNG